MSVPTCRELLKSLQAPESGVAPKSMEGILASRVECVLALAQKRHAAEAYDTALRDVVRLLNGEEP